jgi:uncharacterized membrane protein
MEMKMKFKTSMLLGLIAIGVFFAVTAYLYPGLPDPMPSHWNAMGEIDGYMAKPWGAYLLPLLTLAIWFLFLVVAYISPQGFRLDKFMPVVGILQLATTGFMIGVGALVLLSSQGNSINAGNFIAPGLGILLIVVGNYMSKLRKNFFMGIKTPWTLASDEVWDRTHRLAGKTFVLGGIAMMFFPLVPKEWYIVSVVLLASLTPVVYSFVIYKQLEGFVPEKDED